MRSRFAALCALAMLLLDVAGTRVATEGRASSSAPAGVDAGFLRALEWRPIGPPRGGRAPAVAGDPRNPLVFYFGAASGGVWKTTDAGLY